MATLYKRNRSKAWYARYADTTGKKHWRSTGTANRNEAEEIARTWDRAITFARADRLTADKVRELIGAGVEEIFLARYAEVLPKDTVRAWCAQWLESKKIETAATTVSRYEGILSRWFTFLGAKADRDIATITAKDVLQFRDSLAKELSTSSANLAVKTLRVALGAAWKHGVLTSNPAALVDKIKTKDESKRRPFTVPEIRKLLDAAGDSEWRGIILVAAYAATRLGDIARFRWSNVDLNAKELSYIVGKTGKRIVLPMAKPLVDYFTSLPSTDDSTAYVFPKSAEAAKRVGTLSNAFHALLVNAGFATERTKKNTGKGRNAARPVGELSFHCLRYSAVTFLKAAGVSDALAQAIAGHSSSAVSQIYTHLSAHDLRAAVNKLPDVVGKTKRESK